MFLLKKHLRAEFDFGFNPLLLTNNYPLNEMAIVVYNSKIFL